MTPVCAILLFLTGCGNQFHYDSNWKAISAEIGTQWQVNQDHVLTDSDSAFQWTIYVGAKAKTPNFTYWTTQSSWKQLSPAQAKQQLGSQWKLVPSGHFYFYQLSTPNTAWVVTPATMVSVAANQQDSHDGTRLVQYIVYGSVQSAPIFLTTVPVQLTSISTNQSEQSITYDWAPIS